MAAVISRQLTSKQKSTTGMSNPHLSKEQQSKLLAAPARVPSNTSNASHASSTSSVSSRTAHYSSSQDTKPSNEAPVKKAGPGPPGGADRPSKTEGGHVKGATVIRQKAQPNGNLDADPKQVSAANRLSEVSGGSFNVESSRSTTPNPSTTPLLSSTPVPPVSGGDHSGSQISNPLLKEANGGKIIGRSGPGASLQERNGGRDIGGDAELREREEDDEDEPSKLVTRIVAGVAIALVAAAVVLVAIMLKLSAHLDSKGICADLI